MRRALGFLPALDACLASGDRVLIATDFDGTLCPLAAMPAAACVPPPMREVLGQMLCSGRLTLAVLSGRALSDLAARVPVPAILAGNHGFEIRGPGIEFEHAEASRWIPQLAAAMDAVRESIAHIAGAWVENKRLTATVHYRQTAPSNHVAVTQAVRRCISRYGATFSLRAGKQAIEVYPRCGWNKGSALTWIREQFGLAGSPCICFGDDRTDESMFAVNAGFPNIHVGPADRTLAQHSVYDYVDLLAVFAHLAHTAQSADSAAAVSGAA
jgi:trehalose 6-phosphate phosphatase